MPYRTKQPLVYIAISPNACATAIGVKPREIEEAIASGDLPCFQKGIRRRVLVAHLERFVLGWKKSTKRKSRKAPPCPQ